MSNVTADENVKHTQPELEVLSHHVRDPLHNLSISVLRMPRNSEGTFNIPELQPSATFGNH